MVALRSRRLEALLGGLLMASSTSTSPPRCSRPWALAQMTVGPTSMGECACQCRPSLRRRARSPSDAACGPLAVAADSPRRLALGAQAQREIADALGHLFHRRS